VLIDIIMFFIDCLPARVDNDATAISVYAPCIITAALFSFTLAWGEYLYSITFVTDSYEKTIPSAVVGELIRGDVYHWGGLMAGALQGSIPIALIYVIFLDYYVSGLTAGATKG
jgi:multiple sugar transport system permease protein